MAKQQSAAPAVFIIVVIVCLQAICASLAAQSAAGFIMLWAVAAMVQAFSLILIWYTLRIVLVLNTRLKRIEEKLGVDTKPQGQGGE